MIDTPTHYSKAQRRLLTAIGGLGVAALAAAAFVLSYDDLRTLAIRGGAVRHRAFLYPVILDGLVVVVVLSILAARRRSWWSRAVRWLLLLILITGAGAAGVERALNGYRALPHHWVSPGVAAAPWVVLLIAVWLWTAMIKQALRTRRGRAAVRAGGAPSGVPERPAGEPVPTIMDGDIVPGFSREEPFPGTRPLPRPAAVRELAPAADAEPAGPDPGPGPGQGSEPEPARHAPEAHAEPIPRPDRADAELIGYPEYESGGESVFAQEAAVTAHADDDPASVPPRDPPEDDPASGEPVEDATPHAAAGERAAPADPGTDQRTEAGTDPGPGAGTDQRPEAETDPGAEPGTTGAGTGADGHLEEDAETTAPRTVARAFLPTDVRLVGPPPPGNDLRDTQPDGIKLPDTDPDGIPVLRAPRPPAARPAGDDAARHDAIGDDATGEPDGRRQAHAEEDDADDDWLFEAEPDHPAGDRPDAGEDPDTVDTVPGRRRAGAPAPDADEVPEDPASDGAPEDPAAPGQDAPPPPSGVFRSSPTPPHGRG